MKTRGRRYLMAIQLSFAVILTILTVGCNEGTRGSKDNNSAEATSKHRIVCEFILSEDIDMISFPLQFNDKEYLFVVDTGSTFTIFDISLREQLGEALRTVTVLTPGDPVEMELFDGPDTNFGPVNLRRYGPVLCTDLGIVSANLGKKVGGLIGMNFLKHFAVQVDFDSKLLRLFEPEGGEKPDWGPSVAMGFYRGALPAIQAEIVEGKPHYFQVDAGFNGEVDLYHKGFKVIVSECHAPTTNGPVESLGGIAYSMEARLGDFKVGSHTYRDLIYSESPDVSRVGIDFLSRHLVTFDFSEKKLYLKKGKDFGVIRESNMSGIALVKKSGKIIAYLITEGSPAYTAGLKANDVIEKVNGKEATDYTLLELTKLVRSGDGKSIEMTVTRDGDTKHIAFRLKKAI